MELIRKERRFCVSCMKEHEVQIIQMSETSEFKGLEINFKSIYEYCDITDEYLEDEEMLRANNLALKDAYRNEMGLLTSTDIVSIRNKFDVSQKDFSQILGWGQATITRYENYQVQDRAHDDILRKINEDPSWFIEMLERSKEELSKKLFDKYLLNAKFEQSKKSNEYLKNSIESIYLKFDNHLVTGSTKLNLDKTIETVNFFASNINNLYKTKLMKLLWYSDYLSYKRFQHSITGLVYQSYPMGALPVGHEQLIDLDGLNVEIIINNYDSESYRFHALKSFRTRLLNQDEEKVLKDVLKMFGHLLTQEIIDRMHQEDAYKKTNAFEIITYQYADTLSIK